MNPSELNQSIFKELKLMTHSSESWRPDYSRLFFKDCDYTARAIFYGEIEGDLMISNRLTELVAALNKKGFICMFSRASLSLLTTDKNIDMEDFQYTVTVTAKFEKLKSLSLMDICALSLNSEIETVAHERMRKLRA